MRWHPTVFFNEYALNLPQLFRTRRNLSITIDDVVSHRCAVHERWTFQATSRILFLSVCPSVCEGVSGIPLVVSLSVFLEPSQARFALTIYTPEATKLVWKNQQLLFLVLSSHNSNLAEWRFSRWVERQYEKCIFINCQMQSNFSKMNRNGYCT